MTHSNLTLYYQAPTATWDPWQNRGNGPRRRQREHLGWKVVGAFSPSNPQYDHKRNQHENCASHIRRFLYTVQTLDVDELLISADTVDVP